VIAFGKLSARISGKPVLLPGGTAQSRGPHRRHLLRLRVRQRASVAEAMTPMIVMTVVALLFGVHMVMAIGGADMPVVVSMLNSYSGWAAAATGFMLSNDLLIVTGALVGSSGAILSYIMCRAMNRNFISVIAGGFGTDSSAPAAAGAIVPAGEVTPMLAPEAAELLRDAKNVIIVPGYGMAVAQAQHTVYEITKTLREKGCQRALRHSPGGRPHARPHERAAGGGQGAVRHRVRDGRAQRRLPGHRRRDGHRRQRHREPRRRRKTRGARSPACPCSKCGRPRRRSS
jgi:NAD/NADP transhydrogenase beta subunit